jgi:Raf kinase inhibitor-like YbhB/YbcL family protein
MLQLLPAAIGKGLRKMRPGIRDLIMHTPGIAGSELAIHVTSPTFRDGHRLPAKYTADGAGCSPPLQWTGVPDAAASLVLVVEDADSPTRHPLVHAIAYNLKGGKLPEGALSDPGRHSTAAQMGRNSFLTTRYLPPDPPPGHGPHRYFFQLFALDHRPRFPHPPGRSAILESMRRHVLAKGMLCGVYER